MRILILVALIIATPFVLLAQKDTALSKGVITGIVKDSTDNFALQSVTITLYKKSDSSLLNYQITGDDGAFNFSDIPFFTPVNINVSYAGYHPFSKSILLDTTNRSYHFKNILLSKNVGELEAVVVTAVVPITMNGDTLEINPAAFKLDSNAVVEDMLRRVPGITMWGDGTITVNGKKVNNVYVDGKPFFGNDPTLATQNLPKNAIDRIQVYREQDYSKDNIDDNPADSLLTMNIKLREDRKFGYFGKTGAGIGTDSRYESDALVLAFNKKFRGGIAASLNNINKSADLQGMFRQGSYRNYNPTNRYVADFGSDGINKVLFLGGNMQYNFTEQTNSRFNNQLSASYDFRNTNSFVTSQTDSRNSASNRVFLQESDRESSSTNNAHSARVGYNKRDQDKDLSINASFSSSDANGSSRNFSTSSVEGEGLVSQNSGSTTTQRKNTGLGFTTSFRNKDGDDRDLKNFGLNYRLNYSNSESERTSLSDFVSYENPGQNQSFNRLYDNTSSNFSTSLSMNYNALKRLLFGNFSLWGVNMVLDNNVSYSKSDANALVSDFDSTSFAYQVNDSLTNQNNVVRFENSPSLRLSKQLRKRLSDRYNRYINIAAVVRGQMLSEKNESNFDYRNLNRSYQFFTPSASIGYNYEKYNFYVVEASLSGNTSYSIPSIDQLKPIVDRINQYSINLGNPNLKPTQSNDLNFSLEYRKEKSQKKTDYNMRVSGGIGSVADAIVDSSYFDAEGRQTGYLINMDGVRNYTAGFNAGTSFKLKNNKVLEFSYSINYANRVSPNFVDAIYTINNVNNLTNYFSVFYTLGDLGTVQASQSINSNSSTQSGNTLRSLKTVNYITQGNLNINPFKDVTISNTLNYVRNSTSGQSSALWNMFATYRFLKTKKAEVKLSAMDILKQNKNISVNSGANNLSTTVTNGLQQFFMLTLSYYPRQFGGGRQRGSGGRYGDGGERQNFERSAPRSGGFREGGMRPRQ